MYEAQRKTVILVYKFLLRIQILFAPPTLLLVHRSVVFKIFYLCIFNDKKILICDDTADNMIFKVVFVISFLLCIPSYYPPLAFT